jgi:hypothetical protein
MKCIKCHNDAKLKERPGGRCPKCNAEFAFEPTRGDAFTDAAFEHALDRVSSGYTVRFSETHLYYQLARTKRPTAGRAAAVVLLAVALMIVCVSIGLLYLESFLAAIISMATAIGFGVGAYRTWDGSQQVGPTLDASTVHHALARWSAVHGMPLKMMSPKPREFPDPARAPREMPKELAAYSFDRAVICDRQETVDMLLANNFHFENNCAILSMDGYPHAVFVPVLEMLRRNPKIEVYALHDASAVGFSLARTLASHPDWFRGIGRVTDVGLSVMHAAALRGLWADAAHVEEAHLNGASAEEATWLRAYRVELHAIRPEQVIKRLFRAMTRPGTPSESGFGDGGGVYYDSGNSFGSDATTSDGGGDSFG